MIEAKMENNYSTYRYFFKFKVIGGEIVDGESFKTDDYTDGSLVDNEHFKWVEYSQVREEVEEDNIIKIKWWAVIDDKKIALLEDVVRGAIYKEGSLRILPKVDYGTTNPELFVFDEDLNEWKAPTYEGGSVQVWDTSSKKHVELNNAN